jgi:hypothetical protein
MRPEPSDDLIAMFDSMDVEYDEETGEPVQDEGFAEFDFEEGKVKTTQELAQEFEDHINKLVHIGENHPDLYKEISVTEEKITDEMRNRIANRLAVYAELQEVTGDWFVAPDTKKVGTAKAVQMGHMLDRLVARLHMIEAGLTNEIDLDMYVEEVEELIDFVSMGQLICNDEMYIENYGEDVKETF